LIHLYNCTNSAPEIAELSREYIRISISECIEPLTIDNGITPQYVLPLIQTLLQLIGVDFLGGKPSEDDQEDKQNSVPLESAEFSNNYHSSNNDTDKATNSNVNTPVIKSNNGNSNLDTDHLLNYGRDSWPQQSMPLGMNNAGPSEWNTSNKSSNNTDQEMFSAVAWQNLFSSAATPFFDAENDFQSKSIPSYFLDSKNNLL
jgi:hypothetical protein